MQLDFQRLVKAGKLLGQLYVNGEPFPVEVRREIRPNARYSLTGKKAILRLPTWYKAHDAAEVWKTFVDWVAQTVVSRPDLRKAILGRDYADGSTLEVFGREYYISIQEAERNAHHGSIEGRNIQLTLAASDTPANRRKSIKHLLSRLVAKDCGPAFSRRVHELNYLYFQKEIKGIHFKYNQSNWGSCSNKQNLNFSTRLLFAPTEVIDYVIIHELAHLVYLDHSLLFWKEVENAMPSYRDAELWLKTNGHNCIF